MNLRLHRFELPLKHAFTIAHGTRTVQPTLVVELSDGVRSGFGEATATRTYGVTIEAMTAALASVQSEVEARSPDDPIALWEQLAPRLLDQPFALCALDEAAHDLAGRRAGRTVREQLAHLPAEPSLASRASVVSSFTIGIDEIPVMIAKLREQPGWPVYKIKLGTPRDLEIVRVLRQETDAPFRVDANCGWTVRQALDYAARLAEWNVELIEQPLPPDDWNGQRRVFAESPLPLIADESCRGPGDLARCAECFHGVNIKLVKCGGLTPARRMIASARQLGLRVMIGCMTESSIGISAGAQLLAFVDYADLDGAVLLAEDIADGVVVDRGICRFPQEYGCGARLRTKNHERRTTKTDFRIS